jgi:predicted membrane protein
MKLTKFQKELSGWVLIIWPMITIGVAFGVDFKAEGIIWLEVVFIGVLSLVGVLAVALLIVILNKVERWLRALK